MRIKKKPHAAEGVMMMSMSLARSVRLPSCRVDQSGEQGNRGSDIWGLEPEASKPVLEAAGLLP